MQFLMTAYNLLENKAGYLNTGTWSTKAIKEAKLFDGMILLASVPPTGNSEMVKRFLKKDLWKSMKITYAFISKQFGADPKSCRECFFSEEVEEKDIEKYMRLINDSSKARLLDLKKPNDDISA